MKQEVFTYNVLMKVVRDEPTKNYRKGDELKKEGELFFKNCSSENGVTNIASGLNENHRIERIYKMDTEGNVDEMQIVFKGRLVLELIPRRHDINFDHMDSEDY